MAREDQARSRCNLGSPDDREPVRCPTRLRRALNMSAAAVIPLPRVSVVPRLAGLVSYVAPGERLLLTGVGYGEFIALAEWRDEARRGGVRLAFDRGKLEIMVVNNPHERFRKIVALLIETWITETGGEYLPSGQLTHRREDRTADSNRTNATTFRTGRKSPAFVRSISQRTRRPICVSRRRSAGLCWKDCRYTRPSKSRKFGDTTANA